ncbi:MAG: hypothetical protein QNJ42_12420 [Crocosphaera sp.]|nr:hypothetical protein [Crocosphaera sp.]
MGKNILFGISTLALITASALLAKDTGGVKNNLGLVTGIKKLKVNEELLYDATLHQGESEQFLSNLMEIPSKEFLQKTDVTDNNCELMKSIRECLSDIECIFDLVTLRITLITGFFGIYQYIYDRKKKELREWQKGKVYKTLIEQYSNSNPGEIRLKDLKKNLKHAEYCGYNHKCNLLNLFRFNWAYTIRYNFFEENQLLIILLELASSNHIKLTYKLNHNNGNGTDSNVEDILLISLVIENPLLISVEIENTHQQPQTPNT